MLKAVIFDLDDTLIDWSERQEEWPEISKRHLAPVHAYLRELGCPVPELEQVVSIFGGIIRRSWEEAPAREWAAPRQIDFLRSLVLELGLDPDRIDPEHLLRLFAWELVPGVHLFADTLDVLRAVRGAGLKIGLLTNAAHPMWMRDRELAPLGLLEYFDVRLTAGDVGKIKPHPLPFQVTMRQLDVAPHEAIYIGDRAYDDVMGAQGAGMRAVWVRRPATSATLTDGVRPNAVIDSLSELLTTLDLWYPGWRSRQA